MSKELFREELEQLINKHSMENESNTPDHILADHLVRCLESYNEAIIEREKMEGLRKEEDIPQYTGKMVCCNCINEMRSLKDFPCNICDPNYDQFVPNKQRRQPHEQS